MAHWHCRRLLANALCCRALHCTAHILQTCAASSIAQLLRTSSEHVCELCRFYVKRLASSDYRKVFNFEIQAVHAQLLARTAHKCCTFDARSKRTSTRVRTSHDTYLHGFLRKRASGMTSQHAQYARRCTRLRAPALCAQGTFHNLEPHERHNPNHMRASFEQVSH